MTNLEGDVLKTNVQMILSQKYPYETFLGRSTISKTLENCLPPRTPIMTPSPTPICYHSVRIMNCNIKFSNYLVFISMFLN